MRSLGWAAIPSERCPYQKKRLEHRQTRLAHARKEDHVKMQEEDSHLQAKAEGPHKKQTFRHLDLGLLTSKMMRKWYFVIAAIAN